MPGRAHLQDINSLVDIVAASDRGGGKRTGGEHSRAARRELRREALRRAYRRNEGRGIRDDGSEEDGMKHEVQTYRAASWRIHPRRLQHVWESLVGFMVLGPPFEDLDEVSGGAGWQGRFGQGERFCIGSPASKHTLTGARSWEGSRAYFTKRVQRRGENAGRSGGGNQAVGYSVTLNCDFEGIDRFGSIL